MVSARTANDYIKENLETYGAHLELYCRELERGGKSVSAVTSIRGYVRAFLSRMEPTPPGGVTEDVFARTAGVMESDGLRKISRDQSVLHMRRFLRFVNGDEGVCSDPGSNNRWFDGRLGPSLFEEELWRYGEHLRSTGLGREVVRRALIHARLCARVLAHELGVTALEDVDRRCYDRLEGLVGGMSTGRHILFDFDRFLAYTRGRGFIPPRGRHGGPCEETPEWREMSRALDAYLEDMSERGCRPRSLAATRESVLTAYRRLTDVIGPVHPKDVDYHHVRVLRKSITGVKERTLRVYLSRLGKVLEFSYGVNPYTRANLMWNKDQTHRTWIFRDDWRRLWAAADVTERLVLALAGGMGLRRGEIATLKVSHIRGKVMAIHGKGHGADGKVVEKEIPPSVSACIDDYMRVRSEIVSAQDLSDGNLLVMDTKRRGAPATVRFVEGIVRGVSDRAGVYATCHTLRRFYCTTLKDLGYDVDTIQIMMRHASPAVTVECYLYADPRLMATATAGIDGALFG